MTYVLLQPCYNNIYPPERARETRREKSCEEDRARETGLVRQGEGDRARETERREEGEVDMGTIGN